MNQQAQPDQKEQIVKTTAAIEKAGWLHYY